MAFTLSQPLYGQGGSYTAQQDRLLINADAGTQGVKKLTAASAGAMTGDLAVTTTGSGNASVSVAAGDVFIRHTTSGQGMYYAYNDAATTVGSFAANSSGNPRIDLVTVLVTDTGATPTVAFAIVQGTPAASPVAPTPPSSSTAHYLVLAQVTIPNGFTGTTTVAAGNIVDVRTKALLPDLSIQATPSATGTIAAPVPSPSDGNTLYSSVGKHLVAYNATTAAFEQVAPTAGFRNAIINGGFAVDQRNVGNTQTFTAGAALAYSVDRWYGYCTGANVTGARVAGSAPDQFFYRFTGAASVTAVGFGQRIEAANSFQFAGQQATLSVKLASSSLTSVTWTAYYANTTDTFGTLASPTRTQIATGTFTITSTLTRYQTTFAVPAAATTGIEIVFTAGALLATQTLTFAAAQFELGAFASPFEYRTFGAELVLCQRYYEKSYAQSVAPATANTGGTAFLWENRLVNGGDANYRFIGNITYKVTKRATPTITVYSQAGTIDRVTINRGGNAGTTGFWNAYVATSADSSAGIDVYEWNETSAMLAAKNNALTTLGFAVAHWTASVEL